MAIGPIDYQSLIQSPNFAQSLSQGLQVGSQLHDVIQRRPVEEAFSDQAKQQALDAAQAKIDRAKAYQVQVSDAIAAPSPDKYRSLMLAFPEQHDAIKAEWDGYSKDQQDSLISTASGVYGALNAGSVGTAKKLVTQRLESLKSAGIDTTETQAIADLIEKGDPASLKTAQGLAGFALAHAYGPEKGPDVLKTLGSERRADEVQPFEVSKAATDAAYKPRLNEAILANTASMIDARAAATGIARDTLTSNVQLKLTEMRQSQTTLSPGAQSSVEKFVVSAEGARAQGQRIKSIAERFDQLPAGAGGWGSQLNEGLKSEFGYKGGISQLRGEYDQLIGSQISRNLPPGAASDADVALASKGFPKSTDPKEYVASFLRGMAKLQDFAANRDQAKADWLSGNGSLGTARGDLTVNGVKVPAGTTYGDFSKSRAAFEQGSPVQNRGYMRYGGGA